jgi:hypothetical protein
MIEECQDCGAKIEPTIELYPWCDDCWAKLMDEVFPEFAPHGIVES